MVYSAGDEKTASILIEDAEHAIERARRLRVRTDSNLARSEFLLSVVEAKSSVFLQNDLVTSGSYNNVAA